MGLKNDIKATVAKLGIGRNTMRATGEHFREMVAACFGFPDMETFDIWCLQQSQGAYARRVRDSRSCYFAATFAGSSVGTQATPISIVAATVQTFYFDTLAAGQFISSVKLVASWPLGVGGEADDVVTGYIFGIEPNGQGIPFFLKPGVSTPVPVLPRNARERGMNGGGVTATSEIRIELTAAAATAGNPCKVFVDAVAGPVPKEVLDRILEASSRDILGEDDDGSEPEAGQGRGAGHRALGRNFQTMTMPSHIALNQAQQQQRNRMPQGGGGQR